MSGVSDSLMLDSIEYHLFPNMFFFPGVLIPMAYRFRPRGEDVDSCIFDLLYLEPLPEGADHPEPPEPVPGEFQGHSGRESYGQQVNARGICGLAGRQ